MWEHTIHGDVGHMEMHPLPLGDIQHMGPPHAHITCRYPREHKDVQGSIGGILGVFEHMGVSGHMNAWGILMPP